MRRTGMWSYELVMPCGWLWGHVVWFEVVVGCGELEDDVVIRATKKYKHYTVLQSTTPYYKFSLRSTKYFKVVLRTAKYCEVFLRTTKYFTVLKYYSVLQSTTPY